MKEKLPEISFISIPIFIIIFILGSILMYIFGGTLFKYFIYTMTEDNGFFQTLFNLTAIFVAICISIIIAIYTFIK